MPGSRSRCAATAFLATVVAFATGSVAAIDFSHEVVPILRATCGKCHTGSQRQGGFSLNDRETLLAGGDSGAPGLVAGDAAGSELIRRITSTDPDIRMPSEGEALTAEAVAILTRWVDAKAPWEDGFSFAGNTYEAPLALRPVTLPAAQNGRLHPVDRIIDSYQGAKGVPTPPRCDDATFLRRASLDLVGLLPSPEAVDAFCADADPGKRQRKIRALLDDDLARAEHWMTFWNDLLRNDYTGTGFITGGRKQITPWLHRALVDNIPYDRFVRELVAPTDASRGFIDGIVWRGEVNSSQTVPIQFAQNVGQTFLGINLKCASCHDSFVDRWKLQETYDLAAVMAPDTLELFRCDKATGAFASPGWPFKELGAIDDTKPPAERLEQLARLMTDPGNGWLSRNIVNRIWAKLMGRGLVHPVDALRTRPWNEDLLDWLAADFVASGYDTKHLLEQICTSEAYGAVTPAVEGQSQGSDYVFRGPLPRRMTAEQLTDALWQLTDAAPAKPDADVERVRPDPAGLAGATGPQTMVRAVLMKCTPLMASLGRPNRDQVVTSRPTDLTTLEAIQLANEQALFETFSVGGRRWLAEHGADPAALAEAIFTTALARQPTPAEATAAREILGETPTKSSIADCLWAVVMLPEFQLVR